MSVMRHVPFLKALASAKGASDPVWRDASTGFLVLRFFDRWREDGPALMAADPGLPALRARLRSSDDVEPHVRHLLLTALNSFIDAESMDPAPVVGPLMAYGAYLDSVGRWALSAHVYFTIAEALDGPDGMSDPAGTAHVLCMHGMTARKSGDFAGSRTSYERSREISASLGDQINVLKADVGQANTTKARGDLSGAEGMLNGVIAAVGRTLGEQTVPESDRAGYSEILCRARQSRGSVRQARQRHIEAIQDFYDALLIAFDAAQYELILGDLAACVAEAGYRKTARNAFTALARRANAPMVRSLALVNLLELTVLDGDRNAFYRTRHDIEQFVEMYQGMPAEHAAFSALYDAYGVERFESRDNAIEAYKNAERRARALSVHQAEYLAHERLEILVNNGPDVGMPLPSAPSQELPAELFDVGVAIAELSETAV